MFGENGRIDLLFSSQGTLLLTHLVPRFRDGSFRTEDFSDGVVNCLPFLEIKEGDDLDK